ncbi:hypothetical protein [Streptomyces sp. NPDC056632]|uniref:COG4315 family predicted lipoprotein n=1 Tax=Streptomyces sp. NPDC056632 TaxID=3345884 RepID=UPI00368043E7
MHSSRTTAAALAVLALLVLPACSAGGDDRPAPDARPSPTASSPAASVASVKVADSELGPILVDGTGRTLYGFTKDKPGASNCDAACIAVWPALTAPRVEAGSGLDTKLLRQTRLTQGADQATYGDWPLYYYVGDAVPGDVNGQGLDGEWFVVRADGKLVKRSA